MRMPQREEVQLEEEDFDFEQEEYFDRWSVVGASEGGAEARGHCSLQRARARAPMAALGCDVVERSWPLERHKILQHCLTMGLEPRACGEIGKDSIVGLGRKRGTLSSNDSPPGRYPNRPRMDPERTPRSAQDGPRMSPTDEPRLDPKSIPKLPPIDPESAPDDVVTTVRVELCAPLSGCLARLGRHAPSCPSRSARVALRAVPHETRRRTASKAPVSLLRASVALCDS